MPKLVVITKGVAAVSHELDESWATVGRSEGNLFQVPEASVSGRHCEVRVQGGELLVRDLCSTNGTFVGGKKITEAVLKPGQTFRLGEVELRFDVSITGGAPFNSKMLTGGAPKPPKPANFPGAAPPPMANEINAVSPSVSATGAVAKFQILFVDDSMAFLETISELCLEMAKQTWEIHSATSADQALARLHQSPMDLVVLDITIPMVDGIQLLGIIKRRYAGLKIVVLTGKATEENRAACFSGGADLFIEKPVTPEGFKVVFNMLNDLVSWTHRDGFSGTLRQVGLLEVIQMECNARHSAILEIRNQQMVGQIYIEAGAITHAGVGALTGEKAVFRLLSLTGGEFQLKPFQAPPQRTVHERWETLLMEAARCFDEGTVFLTQPAADMPAASDTRPPTPEPPATLPAEPVDKAAPPEIPDEFVVVATYDGKWQPTDDSPK